MTLGRRREVAQLAPQRGEDLGLLLRIHVDPDRGAHVVEHDREVGETIGKAAIFGSDGSKIGGVVDQPAPGDLGEAVDEFRMVAGRPAGGLNVITYLNGRSSGYSIVTCRMPR